MKQSVCRSVISVRSRNDQTNHRVKITLTPPDIETTPWCVYLYLRLYGVVFNVRWRVVFDFWHDPRKLSYVITRHRIFLEHSLPLKKMFRLLLQAAIFFEENLSLSGFTYGVDCTSEILVQSLTNSFMLTVSRFWNSDFELYVTLHGATQFFESEILRYV